MARNTIFLVLLVALLLVLTPLILAASPEAALAQGKEAAQEVIFRGASTAEKFDISPSLSSIPPLSVEAGTFIEVPELPTGLEGMSGPQDIDPVVQAEVAAAVEIPSPGASFDGPSNIANVAPPDPVGDVGPNHYVAMSNLYFAVYSKTGTLLYGPAANNTLWSGFGGACQTENSGDPIVIYDQFADRWILTQFTSAGPTYYNCVAISTSGDPTSTYYRYAFSTGTNFPDYPKYGVWHDAYYISTKEFAGANYAGVGVYAVNRAQMIAGSPTPQVISFLVPPGAAPYNIGDGLLPADLDGLNMPPAGAPNYFVGTMDNGGPYGAPQDALTLWKFHADFTTPANSTFALANTIPVAAFDSIFPCGVQGRDCIPQPGTTMKLDILSYRQRPLWRLAYRNYGTHESLVTNQAVEAASNMAGIRWYEIRDPNGTPVVYQQGTYAPGISDGIHRWMGSIAMDASGNMALGYSASNSTTFPSVWYTGRLAGDPLGSMPQGEGSIIHGTGSQTGSQRWGDYTSMNVDPVDDCTFWYVNQYIPTTSAVGWRLRIGSFKFPSCSLAPDFSLSAAPASQEVCAPDDAVYSIDVNSLDGFSDAVALTASGNPGVASFAPNPVTPPAKGIVNSTLTISGAPAGMSHFDVTGASGAASHAIELGLIVRDGAPGVPTLTAPADGAKGVSPLPTLTWSTELQATSYSLQVATDPGFTNVVNSASGLMGTSYTPAAPLDANTLYYWRVWADNSCGAGAHSEVFAFVTANIATVTSCSSPALAIPDNNTTGVFSEQTLAAPGGIVDLNVSVRASHTYVGDLDFTIQNMGTATSAMVVDRPGVPASMLGCSQNHINAILDDQASLPVENQCATSNGNNPPPYAIEGTFTPNNPLSVFNGQALASTWRITARDLVATDTGTLNEWCLEATVEAAPFPAAYADPTDVTCAGNSPCFSGPGAIQQALNAVASGGQVTVLGDHTVTNNLTCVGEVYMTGASGSSITWGGGAGDMFTAWNCNLTLKGLSLDGGAAANVFNQVGAGAIMAYANNIGNYTSAYSGAGSPAIGHNFWGSKDALAAAPTGMPVGEWPKRLGTAVAAWADSATGSVALGGARLSGGAGTVAIVSFGRGGANAPFDNGISGHADVMCSEFYDAFTVGGTGAWTLVLPVDAAPAGCVANTLNQDRLFRITDISQCATDDPGCWDLAAGATHTASELALAGLTAADLDGTHFVAGDPGGSDPTAVTLRAFSSHGDSVRLDAWLLAALLALSSLGAWMARRAYQNA